MSDWLAPVREALDGLDGPVEVFLRDDDIGWDPPALAALLDVVDGAALPVDLAAIPADLTAAEADALDARAARGSRLRVHQHGWAHVSHETTGRKHEFGPARTAAQQRDDVARGREVLGTLLAGSPVLEPDVFTPPWNRTSSDTPQVLAGLGFRVLSRDLTAGTAGVAGLAEVPVTVDWFATRKERDPATGAVTGRRPVSRQERGTLVAAALTSGRPLGLMLHHAVTGAADRTDLDALLTLLAAHPAVRPTHLSTLAPTPATPSSGM